MSQVKLGHTADQFEALIPKPSTEWAAFFAGISFSILVLLLAMLVFPLSEQQQADQFCKSVSHRYGWTAAKCMDAMVETFGLLRGR